MAVQPLCFPYQLCQNVRGGWVGGLLMPVAHDLRMSALAAAHWPPHTRFSLPGFQFCVLEVEEMKTRSTTSCLYMANYLIIESPIFCLTWHRPFYHLIVLHNVVLVNGIGAYFHQPYTPWVTEFDFKYLGGYMKKFIAII